MEQDEVVYEEGEISPDSTPETNATEEEILKDGTKLSDKTVSYERFKEVNEELKELKKKQNPEFEEKLFEKLSNRFAPAFEEVKRLKEREIAQSLRESMSKYPDFRKHWDKIKELIPVFETKGISYQEAVENAYLVAKREEFLKQPVSSNEDGVVISANGERFTPEDILSQEEAEAYRLAGLSPERIKHLKERKLL